MSEPTTANIRHYVQEPASGGKPKSIVIMLHGLGADGRDLMGLVPLLAKALPDTVFVAPDAPFPCDMAPMGLQWFSLQNRDPAEMQKGVAQVAPLVDAFIDSQLEAFDLPPEKCVLLGFSQGTMVSLYVAPRKEDQLAGVLGYSGLLIGAETLAQEGQSKPPVHLIHGDSDPVVPYEAMGPAADFLKNAGFDIDTTTCEGLEHGINEQGIEVGISFLKRVLG